MMKKYVLFLLLIALFFCPMQLFAQYNGYKDWPNYEQQLSGRFLLTDECALLAERVLDFQLSTGAWPKNIYYPQLEEDKVSAIRKANSDDTFSSIENKATLTEIHFLSNMFMATDQRRYRKAAEQGIEYVLRSQYPNGGWPLSSPAKEDKDAQIVFAGDAMVNVLLFLSDIIEKKEPYSYLSDDFRTRAQEAFTKGIACILNAQVSQNGKPTVWCAQHDHETLAPCSGGANEPPSLSGKESSSVVLLLMGIQDPDAFVIEAIEGAVEWFKNTAIKGQKRENYINKQGKRDFRLVKDQHAADMWSRFYTLDDNRPFYTDTDGEIKYSFEELSRERRTGVMWFSNEPARVLRRYDRWKAKLQK